MIAYNTSEHQNLLPPSSIWDLLQASKLVWCNILLQITHKEEKNIKEKEIETCIPLSLQYTRCWENICTFIMKYMCWNSQAHGIAQHLLNNVTWRVTRVSTNWYWSKLCPTKGALNCDSRFWHDHLCFVLFTPLTSQICKRVVLNTFHSLLVVEFSWTNFEVKLKFVGSISNIQMSYNKGDNGLE